MIAHDPAECARLAAEAREDDSRMPSAPWDPLPLIVRLYRDDTALGSVSYGIARTRNNLPALADQLEAACAEVAHLRSVLSREYNELKPALLKMLSRLEERSDVDQGTIVDLHTKADQLTAERDSLRQQLESAQRTIDSGNDAFARTRGAWANDRDRDRRDLAEAQRRIAELEAVCPGCETSPCARRYAGCESLEAAVSDRRINTLAAALNTLAAALRAILPVYRAAEEWSEAFTGTAAFDALENAIDTAHAAITPEIAAVMTEMEGK